MLGRNFFAYLFMCLFSSLVFAAGGDMGGGTDPNTDGSAEHPYLIEDFNDFQQFCSDESYWLSGIYTRLDCDLDLDPNLSGRQMYTQAPIAYGTVSTYLDYNGKVYEGYFDGNCHTISNLTIDGNDCLGLFGYTTPNASVSNIGMNNVNIKGETDSYYIGSLVGCNSGRVTNCYSSGAISGDLHMGGLVGTNGDFFAYFSLRNCSITNSYSSTKVSGNQVLGGLVAANYGKITNCYSTGQISGNGYLGGLSCWDIGIITNSYWDVQTSGKLTSAGGISKTTAQMKDEATFVGFNDGNWTIDQGNDYPRLAWEGAVGSPLITDYPPRTYTGLGTESEPFILVDANDIVCMSVRLPDWSSCFILANDIDMSPVLDYSPVVDFSGSLDGRGFIISNLVVDCQIIGNRFQLGLIGRLSGNITNLGVEDCNIISEKKSMRVGGLCGYNKGNIENCHSDGSVYGDIFVGGLVGTNSGDSIVIDSHSSGIVRGEGGIGGLVGWNVGGNITNSYSTSSAISDSNCAGGLIGENRGNVTRCYSIGEVSGNKSIGGLIGYNGYDGNIKNSYSIGGVHGSKYLGGLVGWNDSIIRNSFWDVETSGVINGVGNVDPDPNGVVGKSKAEMQTRSTFTGWDFVGESANGDEDIWRMCVDGVSYPRLWWEFGVGDFVCGDGVDMVDFAVLAGNWGLAVGQVGYNERCDLADDGVIGFGDLAIFCDNWLVGVE